MRLQYFQIQTATVSAAKATFGDNNAWLGDLQPTPEAYAGARDVVPSSLENGSMNDFFDRPMQITS